MTLTSRAFTVWARRHKLGNKLMFLLVVAAGVAGLATYAALTDSPPLGRNSQTIFVLLLVDLCIFLLLGFFIARRIAQLVVRQRQGRAGSRLHLRVIGVFSALAITPAILVAIFAAVFFVMGVQGWFSDRVRTAVNESLAVAHAYLNEHQQVIKGDILAMANDLNRDGVMMYQNPQRLNAFVQAQTQVRSLTEAMVIDGQGAILARSGFSFALEFEPIPQSTLERARRGDVVLIVDDNDDRVRALVQLDKILDTFLFVGRLVDQQVLDHMQNAQGAVAQYTSLESRRNTVQVMVTAIFVVVALLLLAIAVWVGLNFANRLLGPIAALIDAADKVRTGNFDVQIPEQQADGNDEIAKLARAFNRMTQQLNEQIAELESAHRKAAWADVARRIAHEIKNPLTPIQLSAERLQRRYMNEITTDRETFKTCTDTIIRQVADIGRMVDEFSSFARMPTPQMKPHDLYDLIRQVVFLMSNTSSTISFTTDLPEPTPYVTCDNRQIAQALTNILKNAVESIEGREGSNLPEGAIHIAVKQRPSGFIDIVITDNGKGLPAEGRSRLTEPYVTTRAKGTGLGLAIVKKIMEVHQGELQLGDNDGGGARITLRMPLTPESSLQVA
ncbi:MAG: ATP-binding protein [Bdellovibrionales bacterium]